MFFNFVSPQRFCPFRSSSLVCVCVCVTYCFCCLQACIFYPYVYIRLILSTDLCDTVCLWRNEYMFAMYVAVLMKRTIAQKIDLRHFMFYFYFLVLLLLPMHAVNMRLYVYEAFVTNTLHILEGLICVVYDILLVAVCYFGMWFVVHDSKKEEMNRKISEEAPKNTKTTTAPNMNGMSKDG